MPKIEKYFDGKMMDKINKLIKDGTVNNFERADILSRWLSTYGFKEAGCGTNRIAYKKDGYIFKIAINSKGIPGNDNEYELSDQLQPYVTKCYDSNGLMSIAEKVTVMDRSDIMYYERKIYKILEKLAKTYVLSDVGPKSFLNWGINSEGDPVILDYAYLRPITVGMDFTCHKRDCDGRLKYKDDFSAFECDICGREHPIVEVVEGLDREHYEDEINTDIGESDNDLKEEKQIDNANQTLTDEEKGEDDMETKSMTTIGEVFKNKVQKGDINAREVCKQNSSVNAAMKKTQKLIVKEDIKKLRKLADY